MVASVLRGVLDSITSTHGEPEMVCDQVAEVVASGHNEDVLMEDAPSQGEHTTSPQVDQFQEGVVESTSNEENMEPVARASDRGKEVAPEIPLLTRKPHRRLGKKKMKINMKPIIDRLDEHGKILCSMQFDIASIFINQSTTAKEMGMVRNAIRWMRSELSSIKNSVAAILDLLREISTSAPPAPSPAPPARPENVEKSGPHSEDPAEPPGPKVVEDVIESGPVEDAFGPPGPVDSEATSGRAQDQAIAPEPPSSSPLPTPAPPSPPSSSTAPPAPTTFKQPLPRNISSPTPFPSQSSSSLASSTNIPPPPSFEIPPASSLAGASSSGPSSSRPSDIPPSTSHSFLHPHTPPSFITIIPQSAQIDAPFLRAIKDEFEEVILRSVLKVSTHIHSVTTREPDPRPTPRTRFSRSPPTNTETRKGYKLRLTGYVTEFISSTYKRKCRSKTITSTVRKVHTIGNSVRLLGVTTTRLATTDRGNSAWTKNTSYGSTTTSHGQFISSTYKRKCRSKTITSTVRKVHTIGNSVRLLDVTTTRLATTDRGNYAWTKNTSYGSTTTSHGQVRPPTSYPRPGS
ncbi:hypothetical protein Taro_049497 [Colocasia esculenta]|uniref:Uncharacterized protein n=1 Tax=Colocasia esculenta TaxID=4460 RepID=A0A843XB02_COLES|nr:hypothetical protein [Colocasia esculenta]